MARRKQLERLDYNCEVAEHNATAEVLLEGPRQLDRSRAYSVGRGRENDFGFVHRSISRRHGEIFYSEGGWFYMDDGSTNGSVIWHPRGRDGQRTIIELKDGVRKIFLNTSLSEDGCLYDGTLKLEEKADPVLEGAYPAEELFDGTIVYLGKGLNSEALPDGERFILGKPWSRKYGWMRFENYNEGGPKIK